MKKVGIIIEARVNSQRLYGKVLKKIKGKATLELMIERLKSVSFLNDIIIATSLNPLDNEIVKLAKENSVKYFRGSESDVMSRVLKAAQKFKIEIIISIPGDCPLIDPSCVEEVLKFFLRNSYDYVSSALSNTFPSGMETQVYNTSVLMKASKMTNSKEDREHVTLFIYKNPNLFKVKSLVAPKKFSRPELRLVLDEPEDFKLISLIFKKLYSNNEVFSLSKIIQFLDDHPKYKKLNQHIK